MDDQKLSLAQQNVAHSHTFLNNLPFLTQKKIDLYILCEPPKTLSDTEIGVKIFRKGSANTMVVLLNEQLTVNLVESESNYYVTTVYLPQHDLKIHSIYHPPEASKYATVAEPFVTQVLSKHVKNTIVLGDFNATISSLGDSDSLRGRRYTELMTAFNWSLLNMPGVPTRKQGSTAIDWSILSSDLTQRFSWSCTKHDKSLSDHCLIYINSDFEQDFDDHTRVSTYVNITKFLTHIKSIDLSLLASDFCKHVDDAVNLSTCTKRSRRKQEFFNEKCLLSKKEVTRLRRQLKRHGSRIPTIADELQKATALHKINVKEAKESHWVNQVRKCRHVGDVFAMIKRNSCKPPPVEHLIDEQGRIKDPALISQKVLNHFYPQDSCDFDLAVMKVDGAKDPPISHFEVQKAIVAQKTITPGQDLVNRHVILALHQSIPTLLITIFNLWYSSETMPSEAKKAIVTLILKNREAAAVITNLRPISLLNIIAKLYERIIAERILWTIDRSNSISTSQMGFRRGRSTESAVRRINDSRGIQGTTKDVIIALDVSGAFDNITHRAIIRECIKMKLSRSLVNILIDYLTNRQICLSLYPSHCVVIRKGVPQGSVLGPLLFIITFSFFLDTLSQLIAMAKLDANIVAFADDCTVILRHDLPPDQLVSTLHWLIVQSRTILLNIGLSLNLKKIQVIDQRLSTSFKIDDFVITPVASGKVLGVLFQSYGLFPSHIKSKVDEMEIKTSALKSYLKSSSLTLLSRLTLAKTSIHSVLTYAADVLLTKPLTREGMNQILSVDKIICSHLYGISSWVSYRAVVTIMGRDSLLYSLILHSVRRNLWQRNMNSHMYESRVYGLHLVHPSKRNVLSFNSIRSEEHLPRSNDVDINLFTDGSKVTGSYCTTCAVVAWNCRTNEKDIYQFKLPQYATAFQCERHAIFKAVCIIEDSLPIGTYRILSDSRSTLESICGFEDSDEIISSIVNKIHDCKVNGKFIQLIWVKGHSSIIGNQLADQACHSARHNFLVEEFVSHPFAELRAEVARQTDEIFEQLTSQLFKSDPNYLSVDALTPHRHNVKLHYFSAALHSARIPTKVLLSRLRRSDSALCTCGEVQTVRHLVIHCPLILNKFQAKFTSSGLAEFLTTPRKEEDVLSSLAFARYINIVARDLVLHLEEVNGFKYEDVKSVQVFSERRTDLQSESPSPAKRSRR